MTETTECPLCRPEGETVLWRDDLARVVLVGDRDYPGFCRVVLNRHVKEMTDLPADDRHRIMTVVFAVEKALRDEIGPDKINLASLGNQVPHLHWHVIPRFADDRHFPDPVWVSPRRDGGARSISVANIADLIRKHLEPGTLSESN